MGSYATVYLGDGRELCTFRNGVDELFLGMFVVSDSFEARGSEAMRLKGSLYAELTDEDAVVSGYRASAQVLKERLDVMGIDTHAVAAGFGHLVSDGRSRYEDTSAVAAVGDLVAFYARAAAAFDGLTWELWVQEVRSEILSGRRITRSAARSEPGSALWLISLWDDYDPRYRLRALLEAIDPCETITLDLAEVIEGGWIEPDEDPQEIAQGFVSYATYGGLRPIVLTEGRFDAEVLEAGLAVRKPHLHGFIRFPDFEPRPAGGAAALRQTLRAFASAGVPNRVIALFDNDAAARDVVRVIDADALPSNIVVTHLPHLPLAVDYPTLGAQGPSREDVNGRAGSIELYLGADALTVDGELQPVVWGGHMAGVSEYQGEVADKGRIQEAFRAKAKQAKRLPESVAAQDWSGVDLVLDHLLWAIAQVGAP